MRLAPIYGRRTRYSVRNGYVILESWLDFGAGWPRYIQIRRPYRESLLFCTMNRLRLEIEEGYGVDIVWKSR